MHSSFHYCYHCLTLKLIKFAHLYCNCISIVKMLKHVATFNAILNELIHHFVHQVFLANHASEQL